MIDFKKGNMSKEEHVAAMLQQVCAALLFLGLCDIKQVEMQKYLPLVPCEFCNDSLNEPPPKK